MEKKRFSKVIYIVNVNTFDWGFQPLAAFSQEEEAKRFIENQDDGHDYHINKLDLYPDYLSCSMDRYE